MAEMPVALYRTSVTPGALVVLTRLWSFVASSGPRWCHPTVASLQEDLGLANGTLYRHLRSLTEAGVIRRERGAARSGRMVLGWALAEHPDGFGPSQDWETVTLPSVGEQVSHGRETVTLPTTGGSPSQPREGPVSQDWHSEPPTAGNRISTGISHRNLPQARDVVGGSIGWADPDDRPARAENMRTQESEAAKASRLVQRIGDIRARLAGELQADIPLLTGRDGRTFVAIQDAIAECGGSEDEVLAVVEHAIRACAAGRLDRNLLRATFPRGLFGRRRDDWLESRGKPDAAEANAAKFERIRRQLAGEI